MAIYGGGSAGSTSRRTKEGKPAKGGSSLWRILGAVGTGVALIVLPMAHSNVLMGRTIRATFPDYDVDYRSTWPRLLGGASARDVRVLPFGDEAPDEVYTFKRVTLKVPFFQFYRGMFKLGNPTGGIDDVEMVLEGGFGPMSLPLLYEAGLFGNASLSLFEAEGCLRDHYWADDELAGMGLPNEPLTMKLRLWREDGLALIESTLTKPGVGELHYLSKAELKDKAALLANYFTAYDQPISDEWQLRDEGFVAARNRHCASKDGIGESEFVERHLFTVRRVLAADGIAATAELDAAYREFATRGGTLDFSIEYGNLERARLDENSDLGDFLEHVRTTATVNGQALPFGLRATRQRDLPEDDAAESTFALLQREWNARQAAALVPSPTADEAAPAVPAVSTVAIAAAVAVPAAPPPVVPAAAPVDDFLAPAEPEAAAGEGTITDYRELGKRKGERYLVHFRNRSPMKVEILGTDGAAVRVRRNLPSGLAEHLLDRAGFVRAERLR